MNPLRAMALLLESVAVNVRRRLSETHFDADISRLAEQIGQAKDSQTERALLYEMLRTKRDRLIFRRTLGEDAGVGTRLRKLRSGVSYGAKRDVIHKAERCMFKQSERRYDRSQHAKSMRRNRRERAKQKRKGSEPDSSSN